MSDQPTSDNFPAYKDRFLKTYFNEPILDNTDDCKDPIVFPPNNEPVTFLGELTSIEFQQLYDCISQGAIIIYPNSVNRILWTFLRMFDCPMPICEEIIECIEDESTGVAQTIVDVVRANTQEESRDYGQQQENLTFGSGNNTDCNPDVWFGGVTNLVQSLNRNNVDALEIFEVITNQFDLFAQVVGNVTGVDETSIDAVLGWIEFIQDNIKENYDAQYTQEYEETVICDLFCLSKDDCFLTPQAVFDYFQGRLNASLSWGGLLVDSLLFITTGTWQGTQIVDAMMLSQIVFRAQLGRWFQYIAFNSIDLDMRLGFSQPSSNWQLLCNCVTQWTSVFDFTTSDYGIIPTFGVYQPGTGFVTSFDSASQDRKVLIEVPFDESTVEYLSWDAQVTFGSFSSNSLVAAFNDYRLNGVVLPQTQYRRNRNQLGNGLVDLSDVRTGFSLQADIVEAYIRSSESSNGGVGIISRMELRGTGTKPSQLP